MSQTLSRRAMLGSTAAAAAGVALTAGITPAQAPRGIPNLYAINVPVFFPN